MKVYISGPISGIPDGNRLEFALAERHLKAFGHEVVNPHAVACCSDSWADHMKADIKAMMDCDRVYAIKGWIASTGARIEVELARKLGMEVVYA